VRDKINLRVGVERRDQMVNWLGLGSRKQISDIDSSIPTFTLELFLPNLTQ
jgi:hypothetical protein